MNAAETIAAAIEKLSLLKAASTPGDWVAWEDSLHGTRRKYDPLIDSGDFAASAEKFDNPSDPILIVTLHRTIDDQIKIMRLALEYGDLPEGSGSRFADCALALARTILGDRP